MAHILRNFTAHIEGYDTRLEIKSITPPLVRDKTDEATGGALLAPMDVPMGLQKLEAGFKVNARSRDLMKHAGLRPGMFIRPTFRGVSISEIDGSQQDEVLTFQARLNCDGNEWAAGSISEIDFKLTSISYYRHLVNGADLYEIDIVNAVQRINGVDQMASIRRGLGL